MISTMLHPRVSYALVMLQFASIVCLLWVGDWWVVSLWSLTAQVLGVALGVWAVYTMQLGRFQVVPDPKVDSVLVVDGPYRYLRHPMYAALIWILLPIALQSQSYWAWVAMLVLIVTLLLKLFYEEFLLRMRFASYGDYMQQSKRLVPFIW